MRLRELHAPFSSTRYRALGCGLNPRGCYVGTKLATGFKKPETQLYRSFLYLNGSEVLNSLAAVEGGAIDEILTRTGEEGGGDLGGEVGVGPVKAKGGRKRSRKLEEEIRRKRTEHAAATLLLKELHERGAIGVLDGPFGPEVHDQLEEHMLLELEAKIRIHPLHQVVVAARAWLEAAPKFGTGRQEIQAIKQTVQVLEAITQSSSGDRTFLVFAETGGDPSYRLVLPVQERYLQVPLDEFVGNATFVAQVDRILSASDEVLAVRLIRNAPQLAMEREGLAKALPDLIAGIDNLGIAAEEGDFFLKRPTVILKPIVIFK